MQVRIEVRARCGVDRGYSVTRECGVQLFLNSFNANQKVLSCIGKACSFFFRERLKRAREIVGYREKVTCKFLNSIDTSVRNLTLCALTDIVHLGMGAKDLVLQFAIFSSEHLETTLQRNLFAFRLAIHFIRGTFHGFRHFQRFVTHLDIIEEV